ncbi:hypothetical protein, partial [Vibrio parahaemolyticus]
MSVILDASEPATSRNVTSKNSLMAEAPSGRIDNWTPLLISRSLYWLLEKYSEFNMMKTIAGVDLA